MTNSSRHVTDSGPVTDRVWWALSGTWLLTGDVTGFTWNKCSFLPPAPPPSSPIPAISKSTTGQPGANGTGIGGDGQAGGNAASLIVTADGDIKAATGSGINLSSTGGTGGNGATGAGNGGAGGSAGGGGSISLRGTGSVTTSAAGAPAIVIQLTNGNGGRAGGSGVAGAAGYGGSGQVSNNPTVSLANSSSAPWTIMTTGASNAAGISIRTTGGNGGSGANGSTSVRPAGVGGNAPGVYLGDTAAFDLSIATKGTSSPGIAILTTGGTGGAGGTGSHNGDRRPGRQWR